MIVHTLDIGDGSSLYSGVHITGSSGTVDTEGLVEFDGFIVIIYSIGSYSYVAFINPLTGEVLQDVLKTSFGIFLLGVARVITPDLNEYLYFSGYRNFPFSFYSSRSTIDSIQNLDTFSLIASNWVNITITDYLIQDPPSIIQLVDSTHSISEVSNSEIHDDLLPLLSTEKTFSILFLNDPVSENVSSNKRQILNFDWP